MPCGWRGGRADVFLQRRLPADAWSERVLDSGWPAGKVREEILPDIGPRITHVLSTGEATWDEALQLFLERSGYPEETYHTFSYSPFSDDSGLISGMLCVVTEETDRVIGESRLAVLRDLAAELSSCIAKQNVLAPLNVAWRTRSAIFRSPQSISVLDASSCKLVACSGLMVRSLARAEDDPLPLPVNGYGPSLSSLNRRRLIGGRSRHSFWGRPAGPWPKPPERAIMLPLMQAGHEGRRVFFSRASTLCARLTMPIHFANLFVRPLTAG